MDYMKIIYIKSKLRSKIGLREANHKEKSQNCGPFPYGGGGLNPIP